ncbi:MAG: PQQ-binding-like beta-propeller repeat protein [Bryobacteraceae bacterium]
MSLALLVLLAQNWPSFRGPQASGVAAVQNAPIRWNAEKNENILWKTPIPGLGHASPVVWGDRVFIATAVSSDPKSEFRHGLYGDVEPARDVSKHAWKIYCLDRLTGRILWERVAQEGVPKNKRHPKSSFAASTPATDGRRVIVYFGSEGLFSYDFDGKLLWKQDLGLQDAGWFFDPDFQWGAASSPIIYQDRVIVQCDRQTDSFLAAYDLSSGKRLWSAPRKEIPSWGTPTVYEGPKRAELITNGTKGIRGYDPATGKELWTLGPNSEVTVTTPIVAHGLIFVSNGYPPVQPIYAIRPGSSGDLTLGGGATSSDSIAWSAMRGGVYMPTPIVYGDYLYTCSNNGVLTVYQARTGERVYQRRIGEKGGAFSASPVAAGGSLYFTSEDGEIFVVRAGAQYELLAANPMGEVLMATPAIAGGMLIVRGQKHVFAVGAK